MPRSAVKELEDRARYPAREHGEFRDHIEGGGGRTPLDFGRSAERALRSRPRLAKGEEDSAEVNRDQHQVEGEHPKHISEAITAVAEIPGVEHEIRGRRQGKPEVSPSLIEWQPENQQQASVHDGEGRQIVAAHEAFAKRAADPPTSGEMAEELGQDEQAAIGPPAPLDE